MCLPSLLLLPVLPPSQAPLEADALATVERRLTAMGTELVVRIEATTRATALLASEASWRAIEAVEARLSTWRPDSELSALNRHPPGDVFEPSAALAADLARAFHWRRETGGAFDPLVGSLVEAWSLRSAGRVPSEVELEVAARSRADDALVLALPYRVIRVRENVRFEEGAFGKGIALDAGLAAAREAGASRVALDLGGQVAVSPGSEPQRFAVADPDERRRALLTLSLVRGSLATSGNSERGLEVDGERHGHLLDPRSGRPAPDFGSLTVWAKNATDADCLSTALYVMGPEEALAFAAERPGVEVVVIEQRAEGPAVRATSGLRGRLESLVPNLEVEWFPPPLHEDKEKKR